MSLKAVVLLLWSVGLLVTGAILFLVNHSTTWGYEPKSIDDVERSLDHTTAFMVWSIVGCVAGLVLLIAVWFHALRAKQRVSEYRKMLILAVFVMVYSVLSWIYNISYLAAVLGSV